MNAIEKHLISLQQQLDNLNTEVATLLALTSANQPKIVSPKKSPVGINRYRQLTNEQAGHSSDQTERHVLRRDA